MTLRLQIIIVVVALLAVFYISTLMAKKRMDYRFGLRWILIAIVVAVFAIWPDILVAVSRLVGIYAPVNMLFFAGFIIAIMVIFSLSMEVSRQSEQIKKLTQEMAIYKKDTYDEMRKVKKVAKGGVRKSRTQTSKSE